MAQFNRTAANPRKVETVKRNAKKSESPKRKPRKKFLAVDVWQTQFGPVSERAVYDIYAQKFKIELHNMKKHPFSKCLNALRKLENPDYEAPDYGSAY